MGAEAVGQAAEPPQIEEQKQGETPSKWNAGVLVPIAVSVDEAWDIFGDFMKPQQYMTTFIELKVLEGEPNAPNCVRYLLGRNLDGTEGTCWAKERLLTNDHENHVQTYRIEDSSFGFSNYLGYMKVHDAADDTSVVEWNMEMDHLPGLPPAPNAVTQMMADAFKMCIKYGEQNAIKKRSMTSGTPSPVPNMTLRVLPPSLYHSGHFW